jgi:hypothetical protein
MGAQIMYTHISKCKNDKILKLKLKNKTNFSCRESEKIQNKSYNVIKFYEQVKVTDSRTIKQSVWCFKP